IQHRADGHEAALSNPVWRGHPSSAHVAPGSASYTAGIRIAREAAAATPKSLAGCLFPIQIVGCAIGVSCVLHNSLSSRADCVGGQRAGIEARFCGATWTAPQL